MFSCCIYIFFLSSQPVWDKQALAFQAKRQVHFLWLCSCCTDENFVVGVGNERALMIMLASSDTTGMYFAGFVVFLMEGVSQVNGRVCETVVGVFCIEG